MQGSPAEIQTPTHLKLIGRIMTGPPHVLSPVGILPPPSSHCASILARKNPARIPKVLLFHMCSYAFITTCLKFS